MAEPAPGTPTSPQRASAEGGDVGRPRRSAPPLRLVIALVALAPVLLSSVVLTALSAITSNRIASDLGSAMVQQATQRTAAQVRDYLGAAVRVANLYVRRAEQGTLPSTPPLTDWEPAMLDDLHAWSEVASICFGASDGTSTWLLRGPNGLELGRGMGPGEKQTTEYSISPAGKIEPTPLRTYAYDPRKRPWYAAGLATPSGTFSPVYFWFGNEGTASLTGAGYSKVVRSASGETRGVVVVDVTLGAISTFLKQLEISKSGAVFIVDQENFLVAASEGAVNSESGERLRVELSTSPDARAAAAFIGPPGKTMSLAESMLETATVSLPREDGTVAPARLQITRINPFPGVDWRCIAVVPESVFLGDARAAQRRSVLLAGVCVLGALALGYLLSRRLTSPLLRLADHVKRIGAGEFESRIHLTQARELETVSDELNKAAGGLRQRMEMQQALDVAMQVQQSLLPVNDPVDDRLQVVGRATYCDATGGDYYDYIDVATIRMTRPECSGGCMFIALGDVQGHGVGAALLMATARAALRAQALDQTALSTLMDRVNTVLATDNRHNRFMTMVLVLVCVDQQGIGSLRFASAGHDPPLIFDPTTNEFTQLEGGDVPLGMFAETRYAEYPHGGIRPGSIVLIGTDGIWEMPNPSGELFGKDRMLEIVSLHAAKAAKDIADALETALSAWRSELAAEDDVTFVIVKVI